jgi:hypothetical protein
MDIQINGVSQNKKYEDFDLNKPLNNDEIDELKHFSNLHCLNPISTYSRKNYDLFINNVIFEPNVNNKDYVEDLYYLGTYYQFSLKKYDLMKKYYLMAIEKGYLLAMCNMESYYECNLPNDEDLQNYFNSLIRGNYSIKCFSFKYKFSAPNTNKFIEENGTIDLFCIEIDNNNLKIRNFKFCLSKIVNYIISRKSYKLCETCGLKNIKHFVKYINKLLYCIKNKQEYKKYTNEIFIIYTSQIFMEYLDLYYYEYLKKIFAPGGKGYIKTKKHFELITNQQ